MLCPLSIGKLEWSLIQTVRCIENINNAREMREKCDFTHAIKDFIHGVLIPLQAPFHTLMSSIAVSPLQSDPRTLSI